MELERQYPEIVRFLDTSDEYVNKASEFIVNDDRYLIVTQTSDVDGGQILFKLTADGWMPIDADTHVDILQHSQLVSSRTSVGSCSASSENDHVSVHTAAKNAVKSVLFRNGTGWWQSGVRLVIETHRFQHTRPLDYADGRDVSLRC